MGVCGKANVSASGTVSLERSISALRIGSIRQVRGWRGQGVEMAALDGGSLGVRADGVSVVFDGRIDNGDEIRELLGDGWTDGQPPAEAALRLYQKLGDDFCDRIIGDYACAVWDGRTRRMVLATDPGALRPLFYWLGRGDILFASEERGLWPDPDVPRVLDERQMAAWLAMLPREPGRTFFRDVFRVPPGHRLIWDERGARLERWWRPETLPLLRLPRDEDYAELARDSLTRAVRRCVQDDQRIGAQLSGGLDSSAVTALAAHHLGSTGRRLTAFTATPDRPVSVDPHGFADEWPHAALVASAYPNIDHVRIPNGGTPVLSALALREMGSDWPVLNASNTVWLNGIDRAAQDRGVGVLLTGTMGNVTISYGGTEWLASKLRAGDLPGALQAMAVLWRGGSSLRGLAGEVIDTLVPARLGQSIRKVLGRRRVALSDWSVVRPAFLARHDLRDQAEAMACDLRNVARGDGRALRLAMLDRTDHRGILAASARRLFGVDTRDPTSDRQLIELCLSIPEEQYVRGGQSRSLVRRAMKGVIPDTVLMEQRRGRQAADWRVGFHAALPALHDEVARLRHSPLASESLDLDRMQTLLDTWPGVDNTDPAVQIAYIAAFSRGLTAGRFIRRVEGGNG
jgi:asparagine synthase (glutamine-hydrolysing)